MRCIHLIAAAILLLPSTIHAADGKNLDQQAIDIARKSAEFLASRPAMSFNWFVSYDEVQDGREKLTFMRSGTNLLVRDKGLYSHVDNQYGIREYYFDGHLFTIAAPDESFYASEEFKGTYEELVDAYRDATGAELPLYALMSRNLPDGLDEGIDGAAYMGITRIAGHEVHHLAFSDHDEDLQIWISTDESEPVPLVIIGTDPYQQGWPQYRAYLTDWDFDPKPADRAFTFEPSSGDQQIALPDLVSGSVTDAGSNGVAGSDSASPTATTAAPADPATGSGNAVGAGN